MNSINLSPRRNKLVYDGQQSVQEGRLEIGMSLISLDFNDPATVVDDGQHATEDDNKSAAIDVAVAKTTSTLGPRSLLNQSKPLAGGRRPNSRAAAAGRSMLGKSMPSTTTTSTCSSSFDPASTHNPQDSTMHNNNTPYNPRPTNRRLNTRRRNTNNRRSNTFATFSSIDLGAIATLQRDAHEMTYSASAARTPIRPVSTTQMSTLKSCLSSSSNGFDNGSSQTRNNNGGGATTRRRNSEFDMVRTVSFSHERVREYEVEDPIPPTTSPEEEATSPEGESKIDGGSMTMMSCGAKKKISSGSLGWRYNPQEKIISL